MLTFKHSILTLGFVLSFFSVAHADDIITYATVNGVKITSNELRVYQAEKANESGFELKLNVAVEQLIQRELLAQEAIRRGHNKDEDRNVLARSVMSDFASKNQIGESDLKRKYAEVKDATPVKKEYKMSIIVVSTEKEALGILKGLKSGKPFASFVSQSIDSASKNNGGALDWAELHQLSSEFTYAFTDMKNGDYRKEPVRTSYGYVVLRLDDVREIKFPEYADVRDDVIKAVRQDLYQKMMKPLVDNATISRSELAKRKVIVIQ